MHQLLGVREDAHHARGQTGVAQHEVEILGGAINQLAVGGRGTVKAQGGVMHGEAVRRGTGGCGVGWRLHPQHHTSTLQHSKPARDALEARERTICRHLGHRQAPLPICTRRSRRQLARQPPAIAPLRGCNIC